MLSRFINMLRKLRNSVRKPIFRSSDGTCQTVHEWTTIQKLLEENDSRLLRDLCKRHPIAPLVSLLKGNLICRNCGQIAHYNVNLNLENLIFNLRALDS